MWPGFSLAPKIVTDGIFLNVDTATKFINQDTVLDQILGMQRDKYSKREIIETLVPKDPNEKRLVVITMYNSRIY